MKAIPTAATAAPTTTTPPGIGETWPGVDGLYAGVIRGENGQPDYHLVALTGDAAGKLKGAWGEYGQAVPTTTHRRDGQTNTKAMAEAGSTLAKTVLAAGAYIASQGEAALCAANLHEEFPAGYHWTSTQCSPGLAWVQDFEDGSSYVGSKGLEFRAVAVRRFVIQSFGPSNPSGADVGTTAEASARVPT